MFPLTRPELIDLNWPWCLPSPSLSEFRCSYCPYSIPSHETGADWLKLGLEYSFSRDWSWLTLDCSLSYTLWSWSACKCSCCHGNYLSLIPLEHITILFVHRLFPLMRLELECSLSHFPSRDWSWLTASVPAMEYSSHIPSQYAGADWPYTLLWSSHFPPENIGI